jgi:hypothetical protein
MTRDYSKVKPEILEKAANEVTDEIVKKHFEERLKDVDEKCEKIANVSRIPRG